MIINKLFNLMCILLVIALPLAAVKAKSNAKFNEDDTAVVYFSAKSHTANIANSISKELKAPIFEIQPKQTYTIRDLNYRVDDSRVAIENYSNTVSPEIANLNEFKLLDKYKKIVLGSPVWFRRSPKIIQSFLDTVNLENKEVYIFVTSDGSPVYTYITELKEKYPHINFVDAKRFRKNESLSKIKDWISAIK